MAPGVVFDHHDRIVTAYIGLVKDEGLLLGGCPFVFFILE